MQRKRFRDVRLYRVKVRDLIKYFPIYGGIISRVVAQVQAVDGVSFSIRKGEVMGLVGESGCGKTTVGRLILRLIEPTSRQIFFDGRNITALNPSALRGMKRHMQIIFQDPYGSLNPRMKVTDIVGEPLLVHGVAKGKENAEQVEFLLETVGLERSHGDRYPHEFSGGQRQRIGIARALALKPKLIVCDEAVSALDISIQAQIINLLEDLKEKFNLTYLFIAHDLSVIKHISDRVAVMYLGKLVETAETDELYKNPAHPYTQALLSAVPVPGPHPQQEQIILKGDVPSPINPPSGCRFRTRCPYAHERCIHEEPLLTEVTEGHIAACHLLTQDPRLS
jgi:oligopeptide transport system ATP-binding protein